AGSSQRLRTVAAPRQRSAREGARAETPGDSPQTCQNGADRTVRTAVLRYEEVTRGPPLPALAAHRTPRGSTRSAPGPSGPRARRRRTGRLRAGRGDDGRGERPVDLAEPDRVPPQLHGAVLLRGAAGRGDRRAVGSAR